MNKEGYLAIQDFFKAHPRLFKVAVTVQKSAELIIYLMYPVFLAWLFLNNNSFWIKSVLVCGLGFVAVSLFRCYLNAPRPYQLLDIKPLIKKETKGKSMPSRHCFSASVIAVNIAAVNLYLGIVVGALAVIIALLRVAFGVHFIKDVLCGLMLGLVIGSIVLFI